MKYSFTWNGVTSTSEGIRLREMPQIVRPEERVNHIVIPGRSGELTETEGNDIYNSYIQTVPIAVDSLAHVKDIEWWLRGDGYVTFCNESNRKQRARVINAVTFQKHSKNSSWYEAEVQFYCDPLKEALTESSIEITSSGGTITNPGDVESRPLITIIGSGDITIRINDRALVLEGVVSGWKVDSDLEWVIDGTTPLSGVCSGDFPRIRTGESAVQWTGNVTKLIILPRWRYL